MLAVLLFLGGLVSLNNAADLAPTLVASNSIMSNQYMDSVILTLPPCQYSGQRVDVEVVNLNTKLNNTLTNAFTVPTCDNITCPGESTAVNRNIGYQLTGLNGSTSYQIRYKIGSNYSTPVTISTITAADYNTIGNGYSGRSAPMIIITVLLAVAAFILLIGLIVGTVLASTSK